MTFTFKLSRRLARLRALSLLAALFATVSCSGEDLNEPSTPAAGADPASVTIFPDSTTVAVNGQAQFEADPSMSGATISSYRWKSIRRFRQAKVTVAPATAALRANATQTFNATTAAVSGTAMTVKLAWRATGGQIDDAGHYTAGNKPGRFMVIVSTLGGLSDTASVTIADSSTTTPTPAPPTPTPPTPTPATVSQVVLTPANPATKTSGSVNFSAEGRAQDGSSIAITPVYSASAGSITSSGKYTAPASAGTYSVIAQDPVSGKADTASVSVTADPPVLSQVILSPASASVAEGAGKQFTATGKLSTGATASIASRYSASGGTISSSGMYTAGKAAGNFKVIATDTATGMADTSSVTITSVIGSIVVTPSTASLTTGQTKQLTVAVLDLAGSALSGQTLSWNSASTATATVSSSGLVTAVAAGTVKITASAGSLSDESTITVTAPAPVPAPAPAPPPPPPSTSVAGCPSSGYKRLVNVSSQSQLVSAINGAQPGDQIQLADGTYRGSFQATADGSSSSPITVCGSRSAVIDNGGGYVLVAASNWTLQGFKVTNGLFGIRVEGGSGNVFQGLEVSGIGQEGIHLLKFSSDNVVRSNWIHDTGESTPQYGEGVYLGTDQSRWSIETNGQPDKSDRNEVLDNTFGPNVRGEAVDIKEGTTGGLIQGNTFNGAGQNFISGFTESWVTVKGNNYRLEDNQGTHAPKNGFWGFVKVSGWGNGNVYRGNHLEIDGSGWGIRQDGGNGNVVACDNVAVSAGGLSNVQCQ